MESAAALNAPAALLAAPSCDSIGVRSAGEGGRRDGEGLCCGARVLSAS